MKEQYTVSGFTLIELLLALGISSLLLLSTLALPTYWLQQNRLIHHTTQFLEALEFARSYALITGYAISICSSDGNESCSGTAYENAWIVFSELSDAVNGTLDYGENILLMQKSNADNLSIRSKTFTRSITYNRFGKADYNGRFIICTKQPARMISELVINQSGRVRLVSYHDNKQSPDINNCLH